MSRFDPDPNKPYGKCKDCDVEAPTESDAKAHMTETREAHGSRSHTMRILNLSRAERIRQCMESAVEEAIYEAVNQIDELVQRGDLTDSEAREGLRGRLDFKDAWDEHIAEGVTP